MSDRLQKLSAAHDLVFQVRESLSNSRQTCPCCGLIKYDNFDEVKVREAVNGVLSRLAKIMERMEYQSEIFS